MKWSTKESLFYDLLNRYQAFCAEDIRLTFWKKKWSYIAEDSCDN
jgi:hypothetical protein